ncbi:MAG: hypothetical protein MZU91_11715 [Desulfosudis oleivorans]|nr:hypothetical protein [Desulfosudis oleivorans]
MNALFDGYIELLVKKRYAASEQATEFLNAQIAELRTEIDKQERSLNQYGSEKDILPLSTAEAPSVARIGEVNSALTAATLDRVNKYNTYNQLQVGPAGRDPQRPGGQPHPAPPGAIHHAQPRVRHPADDGQAGIPGHAAPEVASSTRPRRRSRTRPRTSSGSPTANTRPLSARSNPCRALLNTQKNEAYKASSNSVVYNSMKIELENQKSLLEALSKRQSETDVSSRLKGLESLNVWVVDKADYPLRPTSPNKRKNRPHGSPGRAGRRDRVGRGTGIPESHRQDDQGRDKIDRHPDAGNDPGLRGRSQAEGPHRGIREDPVHVQGQRRREGRQAFEDRKTKGRPRFLTPRRIRRGSRRKGSRKNRIELIAARESQSIQAESYRSIRTTLLVSSPPGRIKTILFTSPLAQERQVLHRLQPRASPWRKPASASSSSIPTSGSLSRPGFSASGSVNGPGLSRYLSSDIEPADVVKPTEIPNLYLITSGPLPANPIELLTSEKMDAARRLPQAELSISSCSTRRRSWPSRMRWPWGRWPTRSSWSSRGGPDSDPGDRSRPSRSSMPTS